MSESLTHSPAQTFSAFVLVGCMVAGFVMVMLAGMGWL
jgi:hypothetical protein